VPHPVLLQNFSKVAERMADLGLCLRYRASDHANMTIVLRMPSGSYEWRPPQAESTDDTSGVVVRFPHYGALWKIFEAHFVHNIPSELWLASTSLDLSRYKEGIEQLEISRDSLSHEIAGRWRNFLAATESDPHYSQYLDTFFWLVEDWALAMQFQHQNFGPFVFQQPLLLNSKDWPKKLPNLAEKEWVGDIQLKNALIVYIDVNLV